VQSSKVNMNNNLGQNGLPVNTTNSSVQVVLLQHWASMVSELRQQLAASRLDFADAIRINTTLEDRNHDLYMDNLDLHNQLNELVVQSVESEALIVRLTDLIINMVRENPTLRESYRSEFFAAIAGFSAETAIDLTADEEIDADL